jgi:hypothetical protein
MLKPLTIYLGAILLAFSSGHAFQAPKRLPAQPRPATTLLPRYPPIARAACIQGPVSVVVEVDPAGKVIETDVLYGHPLLWPAVVTAARGWVFDAAPGAPERRREVLRFGFRILPFEMPEKKLKPVWTSPNEVEIRVHPLEPICTHCTEKRRRELRRGGCPPQT